MAMELTPKQLNEVRYRFMEHSATCVTCQKHIDYIRKHKKDKDEIDIAQIDSLFDECRGVRSLYEEYGGKGA